MTNAATECRYGIFVETHHGMRKFRYPRTPDETAPSLNKALAAAVKELGEGAAEVIVSKVQYDEDLEAHIEVAELMTLTGSDALEDELQ